MQVCLFLVHRWYAYPKSKLSFLGRSVEVRESEFNVALTKLKNIVSRNRVRREAQDQRRHEKKGYKRRRLASVRWRKRFAYEVCMFRSWITFYWPISTTSHRFGRRSNSSTPSVRGVHDVYIICKIHRSLLPARLPHQDAKSAYLLLLRPLLE